MKRSVLVLLVATGLAACASPAAPPAPATMVTAAAEAAPPSPGARVSAAPALSADGKHFVGEAKFEGPCAPAGGRGGCYRFVFQADGRAQQTLLDANDVGTYRIDGGAIVYRSARPDAKEQRLESADGFRTLAGGYRFAP